MTILTPKTELLYTFNQLDEESVRRIIGYFIGDELDIHVKNKYLKKHTIPYIIDSLSNGTYNINNFLRVIEKTNSVDSPMYKTIFQLKEYIKNTGFEPNDRPVCNINNWLDDYRDSHIYQIVCDIFNMLISMYLPGYSTDHPVNENFVDCLNVYNDGKLINLIEETVGIEDLRLISKYLIDNTVNGSIQLDIFIDCVKEIYGNRAPLYIKLIELSNIIH